MLTMFFHDICLWQRIYRQWQSNSVSKGNFFKHVLPNLCPSDKPLPTKFTSYRDFDIQDKEDDNLALDDESTTVSTID